MRPWEDHRVYRCLERRLIPYVLPLEIALGAVPAIFLVLARVCRPAWAIPVGIGVAAALAVWRHYDGGRRDSLTLWLRSKSRAPRYYSACAAWDDPARQKPWRDAGRG